MNCNIIKDLMPLCIDCCASNESDAEVKAHLKSCNECKNYYESMALPQEADETKPVSTKKLTRVNDWKASLLQSILLFISFGAITLGVAKEASTGYGMTNGLFAINLVVPATGFMLSLANWYFVKLYKSAKSFSNWSSLITLFITVAGAAWTFWHYEWVPSLDALFAYVMRGGIFTIFGWAIFNTVFCCLVSKFASAYYAKMLGKE